MTSKDIGVTGASVPSPAVFRPVHAWWTVIVLMIFQTIALLDRQIMSLMIIEIRADLGLNDFQISLFQGLAFVLLYSVAGLYIGRLVDSHSAKRILYWCVTLWSFAAAMTGVARTYWGMVAARITVGLGEGGINPCAHALIASLFPKSRVSFPMSLFTLSGALGIGLSFFGGGLLLEMFTHRSVPGLESFAPWRQVLIVTAVPGIVLAFLSLTLLESRPLAKKAVSTIEGWRELGRFLVAERKLFAPFGAGITLHTLTAYAVFSWAPTYGRRLLDLSPVQIGTEMGLISTIGGLLAAGIAGFVVDKQFARGKIDFVMRVLAFGGIAVVPFCILGFTLNQHAAFITALIAVQILVSAALGPATGALQIATPPEMRGRMAALMIAVTSSTGYAVGPIVVGGLTDYVFADPQKVGYSIAATVLVIAPLSAWSFWSARTHFAARVARSTPAKVI